MQANWTKSTYFAGARYISVILAGSLCVRLIHNTLYDLEMDSVLSETLLYV